jgi:hypothetical protein
MCDSGLMFAGYDTMTVGMWAGGGQQTQRSLQF